MNDLSVGLPTAYGLATYPPGASFGPRSASDYEFVWIIEGSAEYRAGPSIFEAPSDSLLLCQPPAPQLFHWDPQKRTRHAYFHFQILSVPEDWPPPHAWPVVRELPENDIVRPLFRYLLTRESLQETRQVRLSIELILTAFIFGKLAAGHIQKEVWPEAVQQACAYIYRMLEADPGSRVSLPELACAVSVTPEHLCRLFKASLGHSPAETVRLVRLEYALGLLARSNYSITEISALCGFATPYHFSRLFKQVYQRTPTEIRISARSGQMLPLPQLVRTSQINLGPEELIKQEISRRSD